uniref:Uncharacterized protein n=1 Tax=Anguilla anguilla TaxID=7936 RepID=A0A0E9UTA3_ANGAN
MVNGNGETVVVLTPLHVHFLFILCLCR